MNTEPNDHKTLLIDNDEIMKNNKLIKLLEEKLGLLNNESLK
jgi:hypothetical protein